MENSPLLQSLDGSTFEMVMLDMLDDTDKARLMQTCRYMRDYFRSYARGTGARPYVRDQLLGRSVLGLVRDGHFLHLSCNPEFYTPSVLIDVLGNSRCDSISNWRVYRIMSLGCSLEKLFEDPWTHAANCLKHASCNKCHLTMAEIDAMCTRDRIVAVTYGCRSFRDTDKPCACVQVFMAGKIGLCASDRNLIATNDWLIHLFFTLAKYSMRHGMCAIAERAVQYMEDAVFDEDHPIYSVEAYLRDYCMRCNFQWTKRVSKLVACAEMNDRVCCLVPRLLRLIGTLSANATFNVISSFDGFDPVDRLIAAGADMDRVTKVMVASKHLFRFILAGSLFTYDNYMQLIDYLRGAGALTLAVRNMTTRLYCVFDRSTHTDVVDKCLRELLPLLLHSPGGTTKIIHDTLRRDAPNVLAVILETAWRMKRSGELDEFVRTAVLKNSAVGITNASPRTIDVFNAFLAKIGQTTTVCEHTCKYPICMTVKNAEFTRRITPWNLVWLDAIYLEDARILELLLNDDRIVLGDSSIEESQTESLFMTIMDTAEDIKTKLHRPDLAEKMMRRYAKIRDMSAN